MAEHPAAAATADLPDSADLKRAERFVHEAFLHAGEDAATALAPGTHRRRALDLALRELDEGAKAPSTKWRRRWSLLLGLERVLSEDEPHLADGTLLNPHQVDALSGTLTALLAEAMRRAAANHANGNGAAGVAEDGSVAAPVLAVDEEPAEEQHVVPEPEPEPEPDDDEPDDDEDDEHDDEESGEALDVEIDLEELPDEAPDEALDYDDEPVDGHVDDDIEVEGAPEDPNAHKRFWFEHATGAGKTVAAMGFVEASRTGGVLILTHRRNLVDQFIGEITTRGYKKRLSPPLLDDDKPTVDGPLTVETYQWFVRNAGRISDAYTIVICDEAHTALGDKTSAAIRAWTGPVFIGMTATGALIARHVTDLFPTQTSRFDLAQAARRGVIAPLRSIRIPPGPGVRTIAKVPLRRGEVDVEFDQEMLAELLDQMPFNMAIADLYKSRFNGVPGVVYTAGVRHAYNVAEAFREIGIKAEAVSGETPKRELAEILAKYEAGKIDVLVNAQLLAEGWNSPRATVCMHLAPTASKRIYQQRVGRVTRRHPGKEAGVVVDFVHPATRHDDPVVTLHSLLDRDVYRGGAIVVGPVRRGRGRRVRVERRVIPVCAEEERRHEVFERELWRIAVEHLDWGEQHMWSALAGARVQPNGWRRARAMLHFDKTGELKRRFLITAVERNKNAQLRLRALSEIAASRDPEAFDLAHDVVGTWGRDERREGTKILLQALAERRIGRRDQANAWIWRLAENTRDIHEEYAVQRWPETKRLLGLLVNSSGHAHARNARRLVHASRTQDRRLQAAILAAAVGHTPEGESVLRDARTRLARKPSALSRELLRNFPKGRKRNRRRKRRGGNGNGEHGNGSPQAEGAVAIEQTTGAANGNGGGQRPEGDGPSKSRNRRRSRARAKARAAEGGAVAAEPVDAATFEEGVVAAEPVAPRDEGATGIAEPVSVGAADDVEAPVKPKPKRASRARSAAAKKADAASAQDEAASGSGSDAATASPVEEKGAGDVADEIVPEAPKRKAAAKPAKPAAKRKPAAKPRAKAKAKAAPAAAETTDDGQAIVAAPPKRRAPRKKAAEPATNGAVASAADAVASAARAASADSD